MICDECETVAHCMKNGCVPKQSAQLDLPDFIAGALGVSRGTAYDMMREALAEESSGTEQPAQQAPVAWQVEMFIAGEWAPLGNPQRSKTKAEALASNPALPKEHQRLFPVYTSPPAQRKPLTDEEIWQVWGPVAKRMFGMHHLIHTMDVNGINNESMVLNLARAIEAKLKEKNNEVSSNAAD